MNRMATAQELEKIERLISGEIKPGSSEGIEARRTAARLLRKGDFAIQQRLASTIDPDNADAEPYGAQMFFKRRPGNRSKIIDDRNVAAFIWHEKKAGRAKPYQSAVVELGVSERAAKAAYARWKPEFEKYGSKLKGLTRIEK
jgi:hypothetical protein